MFTKSCGSLLHRGRSFRRPIWRLFYATGHAGLANRILDDPGLVEALVNEHTR
jgi:hypothetical protein